MMIGIGIPISQSSIERIVFSSTFVVRTRQWRVRSRFSPNREGQLLGSRHEPALRL